MLFSTITTMIVTSLSLSLASSSSPSSNKSRHNPIPIPTPTSCEPTGRTFVTTVTTTTEYETTITEKAAHSCYTYTEVATSPEIRCKPFTKICREPQCLVLETRSIPCHDNCCPTTSTTTSYRGCQTACEPHCPKVTMSCGTRIGGEPKETADRAEL